MIRGRDKLRKIEPIIKVLIAISKIFPISIRRKMFILFRGMTGNVGLLIRYILLKTIAKSCGNNVSCHPNVYIFKPENLSLGSNISIHPMCYIEASGDIDIGNDVSIAHGTTIMSETHLYENNYIPIVDQGIALKKVLIKDNVWIGAKVTILCGITIHSGSIIGANSVVTKNVPHNTIVGGAPARIIKYRGCEIK